MKIFAGNLPNIFVSHLPQTFSSFQSVPGSPESGARTMDHLDNPVRWALNFENKTVHLCFRWLRDSVLFFHSLIYPSCWLVDVHWLFSDSNQGSPDRSSVKVKWFECYSYINICIDHHIVQTSVNNFFAVRILGTCPHWPDIWMDTCPSFLISILF